MWNICWIASKVILWGVELLEWLIYLQDQDPRTWSTVCSESLGPFRNEDWKNWYVSLIYIFKGTLLVIQVQSRVYRDLPWVVFHIHVWNTTWGKSPYTLDWTWITNLFSMLYKFWNHIVLPVLCNLNWNGAENHSFVPIEC